jgi:hypothetical protein
MNIALSGTSKNNKRSLECPGENFVEGFMIFNQKKPHKSSKNTFWWVDELDNRKRSKECPGKGWKKGMKYDTR